MLQWLSYNTFTQWHFWCHHCTPWPWKCWFWCTICHTFDILDHLIMRYCVDVGHLGKWRRVRIARTSDNVMTQFRDLHTPVIDSRHADKCWYSAATYSKTIKAFFRLCCKPYRNKSVQLKYRPGAPSEWHPFRRLAPTLWGCDMDRQNGCRHE